jgi:glycosyltransferase involved in cell wall biosynthesis
MDLSAYGPVYRWTVRAGARLSSVPRAVVVNSHHGRDFHKDIGFHPRAWVVIPNGFAPDSFRPDPPRAGPRATLGIPEESLVIGHVALSIP